MCSSIDLYFFSNLYLVPVTQSLRSKKKTESLGANPDDCSFLNSTSSNSKLLLSNGNDRRDGSNYTSNSHEAAARSTIVVSRACRPRQHGPAVLMHRPSPVTVSIVLQIE